MTREHAAERIAARLRPDATVTAVEPLDPGSRRETSIVRFADAEPVVVRRTAVPEAARVEARLLGAIDDRTSVPVAAPIESGRFDGGGWVATPLVAGSDLHESFGDLDATARHQVAASFGRYLAELHDAFRFDSHGPLTVADGRLAADALARAPAEVAGGEAAMTTASGETVRGDGWGTWLTAFGRASIARLPPEFDGIRAELEAVIERVGDDIATTPRLFPWDLRPGNALVEDGEMTAVVDWEGPLAAAPALSVAKTEYLVADWYVPPTAADDLREAFRTGYESVRAYPTVRPVHRLVAVASTAVDSRGGVTNPRYPPVSRDEAVAFHRRALKRLV
jgi:aminoglycoside phosphotransferase (APT) family kinase protein